MNLQYVVAEQSDWGAAKGKCARKEVGLSCEIKQVIYFRAYVPLVIGKISAALLSASLGGAHSLHPENGGARRVGLQTEVLQLSGSEPSGAQLYGIIHGFEMLHFKCFEWLTSETGATVKKQELEQSLRTFSSGKKGKRKKFSHEAVIIGFGVYSKPEALIFGDVYSRKINWTCIFFFSQILKNAQGVRARLVST